MFRSINESHANYYLIFSHLGLVKDQINHLRCTGNATINGTAYEHHQIFSLLDHIVNFGKSGRFPDGRLLNGK